MSLGDPFWINPIPGSFSIYPINSGGGGSGGHWQTNPTNNCGSVIFASSSALNGAQLAALAAQHQASLAQQAGLFPGPYSGYAPAPPKPEPIENAGIVAGEIIAHRAWRFRHGLLTSVYVNTIWPTKEPMTFLGGDHGIREDELEYHGGIHAFKTEHDVLQYTRASGSDGYPVVIGTVALWGEVIEHERGYRAEFGKVHSVDFAIYYDKKWYDFTNAKRKLLLNEIRETYGLSSKA